MVIHYDMEQLEKALHDFNLATGVTIDLLKEDFTPVVQNRATFKGYCYRVQTSEVGRRCCRASDEILLKRCRDSRKTEVSCCWAGLINVATPIFCADEIVGYIIFGQIRGDLEFEVLQSMLEGLGLDSTLMRRLYGNAVFCDSEKIECLCSIAGMLIHHILFQNMLRPDWDQGLQTVLSYIAEHLSEPLSVQEISKATGCSKSVLYKKFHQALGCTVSEYINNQRVEQAKTLMKTTDLSMEVISQEVGFTSVSYFSRTFKRLTGSSPLQFKKSL